MVIVNHSEQFRGDGGYTHLQMEKRELGRGDNFQNLRGDAYGSVLRKGASSFKCCFQPLLPYLARIWVQPAALNPNTHLEPAWRKLEMFFPLGCKHLQKVQVDDFILTNLFFH